MKKTELTPWQFFWKVLWWRLTPRKYMNRTFYFQGRKRKVIGEKFESVYLEGFKYPLPKAFIDSISKK